MLRRIAAFVVAAAVMVVLGAAAHSYFVQQAWIMAATQADAMSFAAMSHATMSHATMSHASIPPAERLSWAAHDLRGILPSYGSLASIALLIALLTAGGVARFSGRRVLVFGIAGAAAIFVMFTALKFALGTVGIFGARGTAGLAAQMTVGLLSGVLFARLTE